MYNIVIYCFSACPLFLKLFKAFWLCCPGRDLVFYKGSNPPVAEQVFEILLNLWTTDLCGTSEGIHMDTLTYKVLSSWSSSNKEAIDTLLTAGEHWEEASSNFLAIVHTKYEELPGIHVWSCYCYQNRPHLLECFCLIAF